MTQGELEGIPVELEKAFSELEIRIMSDIVRRIKINGFATASADWQTTRLQQLGRSEEDIKEWIQDVLEVSDQELERIFSDTVYEVYYGHERAYTAHGRKQKPIEDNEEMQKLIRAVKRQTAETFHNITGSMGFAFQDPSGKIDYTELMEFYQKTLDAAMLDIHSGAFSYQEVLERTINTMTKSGIRWVDYESGHHNRIDVAARRAIMTGFRQVQEKINEQVAADLGTDSYEVTYHVGARPTHQPWQGRVWTKEQLISVCGLGTVTGLHGANCYHDYNAFIPGVSVRTYTDEQLDQMITEENRKKEYNGKEYTTYEALQQQRKMETAMRKTRRDIRLLQEGESEQSGLLLKKAKYQGQMQIYKDFSKKMGLPEQLDRVYQDGLRGRFAMTATEKKSIEKTSSFDIMKSGARITDLFSKRATEFAQMYYAEIRVFSSDVKRIAANLNKEESDIKRIKAYLFEDASLYDPDTGEWRRFDPDCAIAQSWQRLMIGTNIKPHDRTLIEHELLEMQIKAENPGIDHAKAHELASEKYNYPKEAEEYYGNLKKHKKD